jgi:ATP-dependent DNA helicase RecQ
MADFAVESYFVSQSTSKISQQVMNQNADKMREFINASTCRRKMLLKYFGENADFENCASCDICTNDQVIKTCKVFTFTFFILINVFR